VFLVLTFWRGVLTYSIFFYIPSLLTSFHFKDALKDTIFFPIFMSYVTPSNEMTEGITTKGSSLGYCIINRFLF
jgi:hypothetical protein